MIDATFDIETIPTQDRQIRQMALEGIKAPSNYKDPATIAKYIQEAQAEAVDKLALDGATNHIVCIGLKVEDYKAASYHIDNIAHEKEMLRAFFNAVETAGQLFFIGHNIANFDLRVLKQRAMILGIKPPVNIPFGAKPWDSSIFDTMTQWTQDPKSFIKLDKLARIFGIPGKSFDASNVYKMWQANQFGQIVAGCEDDCEITYQISKQMRFLP